MIELQFSEETLKEPDGILYKKERPSTMAAEGLTIGFKVGQIVEL
jgi:hypothetical protein